MSALLVVALGLTSVAQTSGLTVDGVTTGDRDRSDFVSFENLMDTKYFDLRKNGEIRLSFLDNGKQTVFFGGVPDFSGEAGDLVALGNNVWNNPNNGGMVSVVFLGPVIDSKGSTPQEESFVFRQRSGVRTPRDLTRTFSAPVPAIS